MSIENTQEKSAELVSAMDVGRAVAWESEGDHNIGKGITMAAVNRRQLQPDERIRVMIVDDSVVIRRLVTLALEQDPSIGLLRSASNGAIGLQRIPQFNPDVATLDRVVPEVLRLTNSVSEANVWQP